MDCSPPGSSVHGIFQARILEWVAISSPRGSSQTTDWTCISCTGKWILHHWAAWEILWTYSSGLKLTTSPEIMIFPTQPSALYVPFLWKEYHILPRHTGQTFACHSWQHLSSPTQPAIRSLGCDLPCITQTTRFLSTLSTAPLLNLPSSVA